jgi:3-oxoacyl-[acyl-carrier-protein] synthase-3
VLNGIVDVANRIELGQIRAGLVVSCESSREINEIAIDGMIKNPTIETYKGSIATLTGGSGAVAVLLTDGSFGAAPSRRLIGGVNRSEPQFHALCRWGVETIEKTIPSVMVQSMVTDSIAVLKYGVDLGLRTWQAFVMKLGWACEQIDRVICHQVGAPHRNSVLAALGIRPDMDYSTFEYLGNMGTVSLPLTAALAEERDVIRPGDRVGFLGIGSGLNCMMLGVEW